MFCGSTGRVQTERRTCVAYQYRRNMKKEFYPMLSYGQGGSG